MPRVKAGRRFAVRKLFPALRFTQPHSVERRRIESPKHFRTFCFKSINCNKKTPVVVRQASEFTLSCLEEIEKLLFRQ